ncbi:uncharacterized protein Dsimw501_GD28890 [Drosophila simulans]|uniref:Uncharacterized protein n=1 Tax=Drosophila simulans TaxID=7240 RepID=A0A0J9QWW4_DROSI|nr:uncharacterized protein Dsimw501_GD28890 [Drosophila simulans]
MWSTRIEAPRKQVVLLRFRHMQIGIRCGNSYRAKNRNFQTAGQTICNSNWSPHLRPAATLAPLQLPRGGGGLVRSWGAAELGSWGAAKLALKGRPVAIKTMHDHGGDCDCD